MMKQETTSEEAINEIEQAEDEIKEKSSSDETKVSSQ